MNDAAKGPIKWEKERIVAALRDRQAKGLGVNYAAIEKSDRELHEAIQRIFSSHDAALRAARIDPAAARKRRSWDKPSVLKALRVRASRGLEMSYRAVREADSRLVDAVRSHFGSYDAALREIGVDPDSVRKRIAWNKDKVIAALRDRQARGLELHVLAIAKTHTALQLAMTKQFGSHDAALVAAGIDPGSVRKMRPARTREEILSVLRSLGRDGVLPWPLQKSAGDSFRNSVKRVFGSVEAAAAAAELRYERPRDGWTAEGVLKTLRELYAAGHDLRFRPMKEGRQPVFLAARRLFGSYLNAVRKAGIDYREMAEIHLSRVRAAQAIQAAPATVAAESPAEEDPGCPPAPGAACRDSTPLPVANRRRDLAGSGAAEGPARWNKDKVTAALLERQARGQGLRAAAIQKSDRPLHNAIYCHFRSHGAALRAAGIDPDAVVLTGGKWDKARIVAALRERRDKGLELNTGAVQASDPSLGDAMRKHFASYDSALEAAGIDPESVRKRVAWDKPRIMAALRERHVRGLAVNGRAIQDSDKRLAGAIHRRFRSHRAALLEAGIDPPARQRRRLDQARVVAALRERASRNLGMNSKAVEDSDRSLNRGIEACFGTHDAALLAAGFDPAAVRKSRSWDKPAILAGLRDRVAKGLELNICSILKSDPRLVRAAANHFGSLDAALREIGIDPGTVRKHISWDQGKVIAALRDRQARGLTLQAAAMDKSDSALASAMRKQFGSRHAALRAAGIDPAMVRKPHPGWTREKVIDALRGIARDGAVPWPLVKTAGTAIQYAAVHFFGSIRAAAQAAGLSYERPGGGGHWTEDLVLKTLRDLHREGHDLRYRQMKEHRQPLFFAAQRLFGSYVNAVRQAGIDYWQMSQAHLARDRAAAASASAGPD